jgi:hypothetical protein
MIEQAGNQENGVTTTADHDAIMPATEPIVSRTPLGVFDDKIYYQESIVHEEDDGYHTEPCGHNCNHDHVDIGNTGIDDTSSRCCDNDHSLNDDSSSDSKAGEESEEDAIASDEDPDEGSDDDDDEALCSLAFVNGEYENNSIKAELEGCEKGFLKLIFENDLGETFVLVAGDTVRFTKTKPKPNEAKLTFVQGLLYGTGGLAALVVREINITDFMNGATPEWDTDIVPCTSFSRLQIESSKISLSDMQLVCSSIADDIRSRFSELKTMSNEEFLTVSPPKSQGKKRRRRAARLTIKKKKRTAKITIPSAATTPADPADSTSKKVSYYYKQF